MPDHLKNDLLLRALRLEPTERTPVWLMRQAGRYLPEYRALRQQIGSFTAMMRSPEVATELALQPLRRYDLDASIVFSDILCIPDAMGMGLYLEPNIGPMFERPITSARQLQDLRLPDTEKELHYVLEAVTRTTQALERKIPLIGFAGSPWTIFVYLLEWQPESGKDARIENAVTFARNHPEETLFALKLLTQAVTNLLLAQKHRGADALMLFDSWGGALGPDFDTFSLPFLTQICRRLRQDDTPTILFSRNTTQWLGPLAQCGCHCLGIDQTCTLAHARSQTQGSVALQGNLAPHWLDGPEASRTDLKEAVQSVLADYGSTGDRVGHIFNLGQGISPQAEPELVQLLIDEVRQGSTRKATSSSL
ncbi:MAG: uroporphyrinogen decarboxylase [Gammaproteobacteria bacterium]